MPLKVNYDRRYLSINNIIETIKKENNYLLKEQVIQDYIPFIIKVISAVTGRFVDINNSEEFSIGLLAFNEAIDMYNKEKQPSFLNFSKQVITRRIIDYIRHNSKNDNVYPFSYYEEKFNDNSKSVYLIQDYEDKYEIIEIQEEILLYEQNLKKFGITLQQLAIYSPKHKDSKQLSIKIAKLLCSNDRLYNKLNKNKRIPVDELMKIVNVSKRTIERNRRFIIAVCLLMKGDFTVLKEYIENNIKEDSICEIK